MTADIPTLRRLTLEQRLLKKSLWTGDCLMWTGCTTATGYGRLKFDGQATGAHRVAYLVWTGPIPEGLDVDHLCGVRNCINPRHLEVVTHRENLLRSANMVARQVAQEVCLRGHALPRPVEGTERRCSECRTERVSCQGCGLELSRKHLPRHLRVTCKVAS